MNKKRTIQILLSLSVAMLTNLATGQAFDEESQSTKKIVPAEVELGRPVDFEKDVLPILDFNCIACHNLALREGKLNLEEVEGILAGGKRGASIVPREPDKSLLFLVASRAAKPHMPPLPNKVEAEALTPEELGILRQWILEGASAGKGSAEESVNWHPLPRDVKSVYSVAVSRWGRYAACGRANQISIYDIVAGREVARLRDPNLESVQVEGRALYPEGASHLDFVHSLSFSDDGLTLASGGFRVAKLWRRLENVRDHEFNLDVDVKAFDLSPDGQTLAVVQKDNSVQIRSLRDGQSIAELPKSNETINAIEFLEGGRSILTASQDGKVQLWLATDGTLQGTVDSDVSVSAMTASKSGELLVTGHSDASIRVWKLPVGKDDSGFTVSEHQRKLDGHTKTVTSLSFVGPDQKQVVSGSLDGTVRIWDTNSGKSLRTVKHGAEVTSITVRPDGKAIASAGSDNTVRVWDMNGKKTAELTGSRHSYRGLADLQEDEAVIKQQVELAKKSVEAAEKSFQERQDNEKKTKDQQAANVKAVEEATKKLEELKIALSSAEKAASEKSDDKNLQKKKADAEKAVADQKEAIDKAEQAVESGKRSVALASKGTKSAEQLVERAKENQKALNEQQTTIVESLKQANAMQAATVPSISAIEFSVDGKLLLTAGSKAVQLWAVDSAQPIESFDDHNSNISGASFGTQDRIVSVTGQGQVVVWDSNPSWNFAGTIGPPGDEPSDVSASRLTDRVLALDFSSDGKLLATGGGEPSRSGELLVWDVQTREVVREFSDAHSDTVFAVEFSRDDRSVLSGAADKFVKIFEVDSGSHIRSFEGHTNHILGVSWKADGSHVASAGADNEIKIWNVETGEQLRTISGYSKQVTAVQFVGTTENLLSCSGDSNVKFHDMSRGRELRRFGGSPDYVYSAATVPDQSIVVAGGEDGTLRVWNGADGKSITVFEPPQTGDSEALGPAEGGGEE